MENLKSLSKQDLIIKVKEHRKLLESIKDTSIYTEDYLDELENTTKKLVKEFYSREYGDNVVRLF